MLDSFNPMDSAMPTDSNLLWANQQSQVRSVLDSYHGKLDGLIEAIQNSVDAVEKRWSKIAFDADSSGEDEIPRIRIELNFDENSIGVLDNGIGIEANSLPSLLRPFFSDKRVSKEATRGHKGVGTTLLAYGHAKFEIHTKTQSMEAPVAYQLDGGRNWVLKTTPEAPPNFHKIDSVHPSLTRQISGTYTKFYLDSGQQRLANVLHNTPKMWATILKGSSALGYISLSTPSAGIPKWAKSMKASLQHRDGVEVIDFSFPFPHLFSPSPTIKCKDLQWLQNNPSESREFSLIYLERNHQQLGDLLRDELSSLENSDELENQAIVKAFKKYEAGAYASLAYKNTFYDEQFRSAIKKTNAERFSFPFSVNGGVLLSSVNMPMADLQSHILPTIQPQLRRRYFLLVHLNEHFSPDIGRKTIPRDVEPLVGWLEKTMLRLLRTQEKRLLRDRARDTRPTGGSLAQAEEELKIFGISTQQLESADDEVDMSELILKRTPNYEEEVVALFFNLLVKNVLRGYTIRALPGNSTRYDCFFNYSITKQTANGENDLLSVHPDNIGEGLKFTDRWLEFKKDIDGLVRDLEAEDGSEGKKYFAQINVAVVWEANATTSDNYEIKQIDARERQFYGATHVLSADNNDHSIEVIELLSIVRHWQNSKA